MSHRISIPNRTYGVHWSGESDGFIWRCPRCGIWSKDLFHYEQNARSDLDHHRRYKCTWF